MRALGEVGVNELTHALGAGTKVRPFVKIHVFCILFCMYNIF